jgi:hypothetical protein
LLWALCAEKLIRNAQKPNKTKRKESALKKKYPPPLQRPLPWSVCVVLLLFLFTSKGRAPFRGGGQRCRTAARSTRPHALQAPSAAHHALPVSGQSTVQRSARPALWLYELCPLRKSPRSQSGPAPWQSLRSARGSMPLPLFDPRVCRVAQDTSHSFSAVSKGKGKK